MQSVPARPPCRRKANLAEMIEAFSGGSPAGSTISEPPANSLGRRGLGASRHGLGTRDAPPRLELSLNQGLGVIFRLR